MPKHHAICETLREVGPRFAGPPGFTSHRCFKRRVYRIKFERKERYQLKTQHISAFSVSTHTKFKDVTLLLDLPPGLLKDIWIFFF